MTTQTQKRPAVQGPGAKDTNQSRKFTTSDAGLHHQFIDELITAGVRPSNPAEIIGDGHLHRFHVDGDRRGSRNGWAVLYMDGLPAGAFGNWKTGAIGQWCARDRQSMTPAERAEYRSRMDAARTERMLEQARIHDEAARRAAHLWRESTPADPGHAYVVRKRVRPHHARQVGSLLVLRVMGFDRRIKSLQFIGEDGAKTLLKGGPKRGHFIHVRGRIPGRVLICEGWATGATLAEAEPDSLVLAAIDAGNLEPVALAARKEWPTAEIVVCCDSDPVGITKGRAAAIAAGALVAVPAFPEGAPGSDFNDLAVYLADSAGRDPHEVTTNNGVTGVTGVTALILKGKIGYPDEVTTGNRGNQGGVPNE